MSFFSDFATVFNHISYTTFDTLLLSSTKQSNKVKDEYRKMLAQPNFKTTTEVHNIFMMSSNDARTALNVTEDEIAATANNSSSN